MLDQCHNIEPKIPGQIRSVMNVQEATAKALLVDRPALEAAQRAGDVLGANAVADGRLQHRRPAAARPAARAAWASTPTRWRRTRDPGTPTRIVAERVGGSRRVGRMSVDDRVPGQALLDRSHRLGADPRNTNYAGGNTSAKGTAIDPVTGDARRAAVGQGLGRRPRHAHRRRPRGPAAGPAPRRWSTSTRASSARTRWSRRSTTASTGAAARRHRSTPRCTASSTRPTSTTSIPDSGIALATAADGEALTRECFGDRVAWVAWRRPGFQLGLDIAAIRRDHPDAIGCVLGGHGITAWGETSEACEASSLEIIRTAERFIAEHGRPDPFGPSIAGYEALPEAERRDRAAALLPIVRGLASTDRPQVGHFNDDPAVLEFLSRAEHPRLAALGTSCPDHFLRTKVRPMLLDLPPTRRVETVTERLRELHAAVPRRSTPPTTTVTPNPTARRCAARTPPSCWSPASGCSASAPTSRRRASRASSTSTRST